MFLLIRSTIFRASLWLACLVPLESAGAFASAEDVHEINEICVELNLAMAQYTLLGQGVRYNNPQQKLEALVHTIDEDFVLLSQGHHLSAKLDQDLADELASWQKIRKQLLATPNRDQALALHRAINSLSAKCWQLAHKIAIESQLSNESLVVDSAELTSDIAALTATYLLSSWQLYVPNYKAEVEDYLSDFERITAILKKEFSNNKNIISILEKLYSDFQLFEHMALSNSGRKSPSLAMRQANKLLESSSTINAAIRQSVE